MLKRLCFVFPLLCAASLFSQELTIREVFQPSGSSVSSAPRGWYRNDFKQLDFTANKDVKFSYSRPDKNGQREMTLDVPAKSPRFDLFASKQYACQVGDTLVITCDAKGKARLEIGAYLYGKAFLGEQVKRFTLTGDYKTYKVEFKLSATKRGTPVHFRPALIVRHGGKLTLRNYRVELYRDGKKKTLNAMMQYRYYKVYRLPEKPDLNPALHADVWKNIPVAKGFELKKNGKIQDLARQTSFQMGHYDQKLYLRVLCHEPDFQSIPVNANKYHDGYVFDDQAEFSITHDRSKMQSYFVFNSLGGTYRLGAIRSFLSGCRRNAADWTTVIELPFATLLPEKQPVRFGQHYYFNVGRSNFVKGVLTHSSYAPGFSDRQKFATLILEDRLPSAGEEAKINAPYLEWLQNESRKLAGMTDAELQKRFTSYGTLDAAQMKKFRQLRGQAAKKTSPRDQEKIVCDWQEMCLTLSQAKKTLDLQIDHPERITKFYVNGKTVPVSGSMKICIPEGVSVLAAETAPGASVNIRIKGHPETDRRWRTGAVNSKELNWKNAAFDDSSWQVVKPASAAEGFLSSGRLRQLLLWNRTHYGNERVFPKTREWKVAMDSVDGALIALYSPMERALSDFSLTMELPASLLIPKEKTKYARFREPSAVKTFSLSGGRQRYVMHFADKTMPANKTEYTFLPLELRRGTGLKAGDRFMIRYYRKASGNFTELAQEMPCVVLPPVNGRQPERFLVISAIQSEGCTGRAYHFKLLKQLAGAGFNSAFSHMGGDTQTPKGFSESALAEMEQMRKLNISPEITMMSPMWGCHYRRGALYRHLVKHPEHRARRFGGKPVFGRPGQWWNFMYCPSYMAGEGRELFLSLIKEDYRVSLGANPYARYVWTNWEGKPWGSNPYCFCDRCIKEFRRKYNIPAGKKLTDQIIKDQYYLEWFMFRTSLDAELADMTQTAVRSLNLRHMLYSQTGQTDLWKALRHKVDIPAPGAPGNGPGLALSQAREMDYAMDLIRKATGVEYLVGQQIAMNFAVKRGKHGYRKEFLASNTDFMEPEIFKSVFVRMAASLHGGILWWGEPIYGAFCGVHYYMGEATRLISDYEPLFLWGTRVEKTLVASDDIAYPMVLALERKAVPMPPEIKSKYPGFRRRGSERLILLFNEDSKPRKVTFENKQLSREAIGRIYEGGKLSDPHRVTVVIPPRDLKAVYICDPEK